MRPGSVWTKCPALQVVPGTDTCPATQSANADVWSYDHRSLLARWQQGDMGTPFQE